MKLQITPIRAYIDHELSKKLNATVIVCRKRAVKYLIVLGKDGTLLKLTRETKWGQSEDIYEPSYILGLPEAWHILNNLKKERYIDFRVIK